ncbi:MAG: metal-dependent hydrolase [Bdellovibrionales bacterium]
MDNITHTAAGALFTEALYQTVRKKHGDKPKLRRNLHILSVFASNFPDFDLLLQLVDSSLLGYMTNHRGHTHTLLGLAAEFLFVLTASFLISKFLFKSPFSKENLKYITPVLAFGLISHVSLDFMNAYGVHPFWPVNNKWLYGDFLYIIEPLLWITMSTAFFHIIKSGYFRYIFLGFSISSPLIFTSLGFSSWVNTTLVLLFSLVLFFHLKGKTPLRVAKEGLTFLVSIICIFALQSTYAKSNLKTSLAKVTDGYKLIDIETSPFPSNFMCWHFLGVFTDNTEYRVYSGTYSPSKLFSKSCPSWKGSKGVPPTITKLEDTDHIKFDGLYTQPLKTLKDVYSLNCKTKAWFTYARIPFFFENTLHDLRYSIKSKESFARLDLDSEQECLVIPSPWTPPREDILF